MNAYKLPSKLGQFPYIIPILDGRPILPTTLPRYISWSQIGLTSDCIPFMFAVTLHRLLSYFQYYQDWPRENCLVWS